MYLSSTLNEINSYECDFSSTQILDMYSSFQKNKQLLLRFLLNDFESCIENTIQIRIKSNSSNLKNANFKVDKVNTSLVRCNNTKQPITIYPVQIIFVNLRSPNTTQPLSHSNVVIVNHATKEIEHFEPNGSASWLDSIQTQLKLIFLNKNPGYMYINALSYCPHVGPQAISETGWCIAFTFLYLLIRLKEPELPRTLIIDDISRGGKDKINQILTKFICFLFDIVRSKFAQFQSIETQIIANFSISLDLIQKYRTKFPTPATAILARLMLDITSELDVTDSLGDLKFMLVVFQTISDKLKIILDPMNTTQVHFDVEKQLNELNTWITRMYPV